MITFSCDVLCPPLGCSERAADRPMNTLNHAGWLVKVLSSSERKHQDHGDQDDASTQYITQDAARSVELFNLSKSTQCPWVKTSTLSQTVPPVIEKKDAATEASFTPLPSSMSSHSSIPSGANRGYPCTVCSYSSDTYMEYKRHQKTHTSKGSYQCVHCGRSFSRSFILAAHLRTHTGERPYQCTHCSKDFTTRSYLTVHLRTHTGEKPYKCDLCPMEFMTKTHLNYHERTHKREKLFACSFCFVPFTRKENLKRHEQNVHP